MSTWFELMSQRAKIRAAREVEAQRQRNVQTILEQLEELRRRKPTQDPPEGMAWSRCCPLAFAPPDMALACACPGTCHYWSANPVDQVKDLQERGLLDESGSWDNA